MRKLFKYFSTVKKEMILIPFVVMVEVIFEILIPVFMSRLIDYGLEAEGGIDKQVIYSNAIFMIISAVLALILGIYVIKLTSRVSTEFAYNLRLAQYKKIQEYSFENIDKFKTSSLITRMTMDVTMIQQAVNMILRVALRAPALIIFSLISISLFAGSLALLFVAVMPFLIIAFYLIMTNAYKHFKKMFVRLDDLNLTIQEDLIGIRNIKSYVREDYEKKRFINSAANVRDVSIKAERIIIFNRPVMQFSIGITFILIGWFGSNLLVSGELSRGQFANTITYINQVLFSLMLISHVFMMITMSRNSITRINEVLEEEPLLKENKNTVVDVEDGSFEFRDVSFKYDNTSLENVIENINLKVPSGAFVGIFGSTGTGKSTIVQLLARLYDVNDGTIYVGNKDIKTYQLEALRKEVILVLQKNVLFSGTVRENIQWGKKDASDEEIYEVLKKSQAYDFIMEEPEGLDQWVEQGGVNFSGGQKQRLTIARALIANPKILILDDSTSAVDTKTDAKIKETLANDSPNMTKVVISQRLSSIEEADIIVLLDDHGINSTGTHQELYENNKLYQDIYDAQNKAHEVEEI